MKAESRFYHSSWAPWVVCFIAALFFFYEFIQLNMFSSINNDLMQAFHIDAAQLGSLSATYFYSNLIFLFFAGVLLDRFSTRKIILWALGVCVVGTALFAVSSDLWVAKACRFFTGIGSAFCFLSSVRLASRWFPSKHLALVTGLIVTMAMTGGMVAQTPMTWLSQSFGWRNALLIDAGFGAAILMLCFAFVRDFPPGTDAIQAKAQEALQEMGIMASLRKSYLNVQNWFGGIYTCLMNLPIFLLGAIWGSQYLSQIHHFSRTEASYITSMIYLGTIIGSPIAGWLSDRWGYRKRPMLIGVVVSMVFMLEIIYGQNLSMTTFMALFFLLGLTTSTQVISYPAIAESNPTYLTATAVSCISICCIGSGAVFQPIFGSLMNWHWSHKVINNLPVYSASDYHTALLIMPIGFVIAFGAAMLLKETYCKRTVEADSPAVATTA